jgi:hypothetical protein
LSQQSAHESAAPKWSTARRPAHARGVANDVRRCALGLRRGIFGGWQISKGYWERERERGGGDFMKADASTVVADVDGWLFRNGEAARSSRGVPSRPNQKHER